MKLKRVVTSAAALTLILGTSSCAYEPPPECVKWDHALGGTSVEEYMIRQHVKEYHPQAACTPSPAPDPFDDLFFGVPNKPRNQPYTPPIVNKPLVF
ncbi:MAG: hypothetical protein ABIA93_03680 [Candidatus Woesearchaeota archaeon]